MRRVLYLLVFLTTGTVAMSQESYTTNIDYGATVKDAKYEWLDINGSITFGYLTVKDSLVIDGSARGDGLKCKKLEVNGSLNVKNLSAKSVEINGSFIGTNVNIDGNMEVNGSVSISCAKLNTIQITSQHSIFIASKITGDILIKKSNDAWELFGNKFKKSVQIVELKGNTIVSGNITFENNGEVHIDHLAQITGQVINGKIIQGKTPTSNQK